MIWKILRPQYWILDRKVRSTHRAIVIALLVLVPVGGQWIYNNLIRDNLALLGSEQAMTAVASLFPTILFAILLFAILGIGDVMHQLYLASDLELLMTAPIHGRTIFLVKLFQCCRALLIPGLGFAVLLVLLGLARNTGPIYYLFIAIFLLAAMIMATSVVMIMVILLARLIPPQKVRSWMPVAILLISMAIALGQQSANQWFLMQENLLGFIAEAITNLEQMALVVATVWVLSLAVSTFAYQIFDRAFHEGWDRLRQVPTQRAPSPITRRSGAFSRLLNRLPVPLRFFMVKEWLELRRDPRGLIALAQPLIMVVVVFGPFMISGVEAEALLPILFWSMVMFLTMYVSFAPVGSHLMAIAHEGRNFALLRSAPVSIAEVLKGKYWARLIPMVLSWEGILLIVGLWLQLPVWQIIFLMCITILGLTGASAITTAISGIKVDFSVEELKQRVPTLMSYVIIGVNLIFTLLTVVLSTWVIYQLYPESGVVIVIRTVLENSLVGWFFHPTFGPPIILLGALGVFAVGVRMLWGAAIHRLEEWEVC
jgi:hypothetical protein